MTAKMHLLGRFFRWIWLKMLVLDPKMPEKHQILIVFRTFLLKKTGFFGPFCA